ncbi:hypothetical protein Celaphus_00005625, partial [Cervus elaphus hippelaphus]
MQALKKQPFSSKSTFYSPPASPQSGSLSPHYLSSVFKQSQVRTLKGEKPLPLKTTMQKKRSYSSAFNHSSAMRLHESDSLATSTDPKEDHNYSASSLAAQRCASRSSVSSLSSVDEVYEFIPKSSHVGSDGSEGFRSEEDTDVDYEDDPLGDSGYASQACADTTEKGQPDKKMRKQACQEIDEELKEAAGSLLHLA